MSDTPGQPAGWYYAQGDPVGTQRYWDGRQWVGEPQPVGGAPAPGGGYGAQPAAGGYGAPNYGGAGYGGAGFGGGGTAVGTPADYGSRVIALLIDGVMIFAIIVVGFILAAIFGSISDSLGAIVAILAYIGAFAVGIWNLVIRQGQTGQSIGKSKQNIKLVADATGQPVGGGMAFVRYLLGGVINWLCYLDYLWPLWDTDKKRLSDKMLNFSVVKA